ncbi:MAG TPA: hypothetical protein VNT55_20800, partial [Baekduia sp.]|nr:hypothetical protein [Baekduia sp.]
MVRRRPLLPLLAVLAALLGMAGSARGATIAVDGSTFRVAGAAGEADDFTLTLASSYVELAFPSAGALTSSTGYCYLRTTKAMRCARPAALALDLGDGNDRLTVTGAYPVPLTVVDGEGDDVVSGGAGADTFVDGPGDDAFAGGAG